MTREEIIECYVEAVYSTGLAAAAGNESAMRDYELLKAGFAALRGPTREQVEKVWCSEWECDGNDCTCKHCGSANDYDENFCPVCGMAMNYEAVDRVMERLEALKDGKGD